MAKLTEEQLKFLRSHNIPASLVFDASGMRKKDYADEMKEAGKAFAFGVTPCAAGRHTLRSRAGHCVQCDTSKIAYMLRHISPGKVYVAASRKGGFIKIGSCQWIYEREESLQKTKYGGCDDWQIIAWASFSEAGRSEGEIQSALKEWQVGARYWKDYRWQECCELFLCDAKQAVDMLKTSVGRRTGKDLNILS
jgi:hypothetical protein